MLRLYFLTALTTLALTVNAQSKIRLIGVDLGYENVRYDKIFGLKDDFKKSQLQAITPDSFEFYNDIGSPNSFIFFVNRAGKIVPHYSEQKSVAQQFNINCLLQIKNKKGQYNPHHVFSAGLSSQNRNLLSGDFRARSGNTTIDTSGYVVYFQDTTQIANYSTSYNVSQTRVKSKQLQLNIGYQYKFFPSDKFNVSLGPRISAGYVYKGFFSGKNFSYTSIESITFSGIQAGVFYNTYNQKNYRKTYSGGFNAVLSAEVALGWRLSKTLPVLKNINVTATGRFGWDTIKMKNSSFYGNLYYYTTFGISYIFDKYYKS